MTRPRRIEVIPVPVRRPIEPGDDLVEALLRACEERGVSLRSGDVVAVASKAVSASQGRTIRLEDLSPGELALSISRATGLSPRFAQAVVDEAEEILGCVRHAALTLVSGSAVPNAGVDAKNSPPGTLTAWPRDPDGAAWEIREEIRRRAGVRVGVLIVDSGLLPLRRGTVGLAIGVAGLEPLRDYRGLTDIYGREVRITELDVADSLASAAHLAMGEGGEMVPFAVLRGAGVQLSDGFGKGDLVMDPEECAILGSLMFSTCPGPELTRRSLSGRSP